MTPKAWRYGPGFYSIFPKRKRQESDAAISGMSASQGILKPCTDHPHNEKNDAGSGLPQGFLLQKAIDFHLKFGT